MFVVKKIKKWNCIVSIYTIARESVRDSNCIVGAIVPRDFESLSALARAVQRGAPMGALGVTKRSLVTETTLLANRAKKPQDSHVPDGYRPPFQFPGLWQEASVGN